MIVACSQVRSVAGPGIAVNCQVLASAITESSNAGRFEPRVIEIDSTRPAAATHSRTSTEAVSPSS